MPPYGQGLGRSKNVSQQKTGPPEGLLLSSRARPVQYTIKARAFERLLPQILKCPLGHAAPSGVNRIQFGRLQPTVTGAVEGPTKRIASLGSRYWSWSGSSNPIQPWCHAPPRRQNARSSEGQRTTATPRRMDSARASCRSRNNRPDATSTSFAIIWFCQPGTANPRTPAMTARTTSVSVSEKPWLFCTREPYRSPMKATLPEDHPLGSDF